MQELGINLLFTAIDVVEQSLVIQYLGHICVVFPVLLSSLAIVKVDQHVSKTLMQFALYLIVLGMLLLLLLLP